jgi:hypothetical protein
LFALSYCAQPNEANDYHDGNKPASGPHPTQEICCRFCNCGSSSSSSSASEPSAASSSSAGSGGPPDEQVIEVVTNVECKDGELIVTKTKIYARLYEGSGSGAP